MTNKQQAEIKDTFRVLEKVLSSDSSVECLINDNTDFKDSLAKAYECRGVLESESVLEIPGAFDSREAINNVLEQIEVIRHYVTHGQKLPKEVSLNNVKAILADVNRHLNGK